MANGDRTVFGRGAEGAQPSVIDPTTYQSDGGAGFFLESNDAAVDGSSILWDTVYGINDESENSGGNEAHDDAAFAWSPAIDGDFGTSGPAHVDCKQAGLYWVDYVINGNWSADAVPGQLISQLNHSNLSDFNSVGLRTYHGIEVTRMSAGRLLWLPVGYLTLSVSGWDADMISNPFDFNYASIRVAPMFTLTGIEES